MYEHIDLTGKRNFLGLEANSVLKDCICTEKAEE